MTDFKEKLNDQSYKLTGQRQAVLDILTLHHEEHLSADQIHKLLEEQKGGVGIATVYRTLQLLEKLKLISRIYLDDGCTRYQIHLETEKHEHHHLICNRCGHVEDFQDDLLDPLEQQVFEQYGFRVFDHRVKFYGICRTCLNVQVN
ncbi:MAG: transcriptional repressor [Eubacteriales bacterium]|nr:transcriptional repressor [Eubacteriales bacterium]